mmetsp:Transcript_32220/g.31639  ORF Transcript_32220/g.31639 Transcript_32220/m.31639 type:complete len:266 (+) Transcript_32220:5192-5989(+)
MLLIDIYFIVTLVYFFIAKKTNKNEIAVVDESKAMDEYNMKHPNKVEVASSMNAGEMRANNLGDNSSEHKSGEGNDSELHQASFCKKFKVGFMLKYRLLTPFTTAHPNLSRLSRGIINCLVLYFIWVVSGILLLLIEKAGASYGAAIPICFIISRLSTFALEILHRSSNGKTIEILSYFTAVTMAVVLHASIFLITEDMGKEFDYWGILLLTVFLIDLIVWEMLSLILQIYIGTKLASSPDNFSGKRKSLEKMVTPPLLKKFIDP